MQKTLFESALKARIPFIGVHYGDVVNFPPILEYISGKKVAPLPTTTQTPVFDDITYWTDQLTHVIPSMYRRLSEVTATCVVLNPEKSNNLVFDSGVMQTPTKFFKDYLSLNFIPVDKMEGIIKLFSGMSLKDAQNLLQITMARTGTYKLEDLRRTQMIIGGSISSLELLDAEYDFYVISKPLQEWIDLNKNYFPNSEYSKLIPKGLMLTGPPGVGKSLAASVLAKNWNVPLFRLDIGGSLTRWLGESEKVISRALQYIDFYSPCILLIDELEKMFGSEKEGTTGRIFSQLLWWLQFRKSKVIVVMTSNELSKVPDEFYREERVDKVIKLEKLTLLESKQFVIGAYKNILGVTPSIRRAKSMREHLDKLEKSYFSHAEVMEIVKTLIKTKSWEKEEDVSGS